MPDPTITCGTVCAQFIASFGSQPTVTVQIPADSPNQKFFAQIDEPIDTGNGHIGSVIRQPIPSDDPSNPPNFQVFCDVIDSTDPCEAWIAVPTDVPLTITFGRGGGDWPAPVKAAGGDCQAAQSAYDSQLKAESATANQDVSTAMSISCTVTIPSGTALSDVAPIVAHWRGYISTGCIPSPLPPGFKTDHLYNPVDFPSALNHQFPFDRAQIKTCDQYPPDDPGTHTVG